MAFRRRCLGVRCKTSFFLIIIGLCAAGFLILYQLLKELSSVPPIGSKSGYPVLERRKSKYQAHKPFPDILDHRPLAPVLHRDLNSKMVELRGNYDVKSIEDIRTFLNQLNPTDWSVAPQPDELAIELKHLLLDLDIESGMSCKEIDSLRLGMALAQSNRKFVERGQTDDSNRIEYTVVSQSIDLETKIACMKKIYDAEFCSPMGNYKILKQLLLLAILKQHNIINLKGYCLRGDGVSSEIRKKGVIMLTDVGTPLRSVGFGSIPWRKRLLFAMEMMEFLDYLEYNPLGSLGLGKISSHDFVLFNGDEEIQLVDMDDVVINERSCSNSNECDIGGLEYGIECVSGRCQGLNALYNLQKISISVLDPLLRHGPSQTISTINDFLDNLRSLKYTKQNLKVELQKLSDTANYQAQQRVDRSNLPYRIEQHNNNNIYKDQFNNRGKHNNQQNEEYNIPAKQQNPEDEGQNRDMSDNTPSEYIRSDQSNFPGMFDYDCINSRVAWGCVITCRSIREAKRKCNEDPYCQSFVVFSTKPELDTLMTVVLKNSASSPAQANPGTTLFIRRKKIRRQQNVVQMSQNDNNNNVLPYINGGKAHNIEELKGNMASSNHSLTKHSVETCLRKIFKGHEEPRKSRERRLMAHFGLKGLREAEWQMSVKRQNPSSFSNMISAKGSISRGGKFLVLLKTDDVNELVSKAIFTAEEGEGQYHVAQSIVYHLDRLLGLYHTPPSVVGSIPALSVQKYQINNSWKEAFGALLRRNNSLKGIFSAPVPHVMKEEKLFLKPLKSMVSSVVKFSRQSKLQFEYVFLWWLAKILKDPTDHIGYKGHLIHFNGDEAFGSENLDLTGYFNHCQFPNIVYKTLNCLRCHNNQGSQLSSICNLGQEVMKRVRLDTFSTSDLFIHDFSENDIIVKINSAVSITMGMVEVCIKLFGRDQVLY